MWTYEHAVETTAAPEAVWRLWADVEGWGAWNLDIEKIEIGGPFAVGAEITMTSAGQEPVRLRIAELTAPQLFVDEADLGDVVVRTIHRLDRVEAGVTRVVYRMEITGPAADQVGPQLGPAITADFPQTMTSLVRLAQG
ncbi:MAG TPA: SRPBCC family protein [Mycobacteriales bacterium]|nr:SRPBCC family protein [Mycobacteriales bacterium]